MTGLLTTQPAVSGFGWAALAFAMLLVVLRTILWDFMRAGKARKALASLAILIAAGVLFAGGLHTYEWVSVRWLELEIQALTCKVFENCPRQMVLPVHYERK